MPLIELEPYGCPCAIEGVIRAGRQEGRRLLLLFNETHTNYFVIRQNLLNALRLIDGGFVGCVGVEGVYDFEDWTPAEVQAKSHNLFAQHQNDLALIDFFIQDAERLDEDDPGRPHFYFGNCLRLLRPSVAIKCVETDALDAEASQTQNDIIAKHAKENNVPVQQFVKWIQEGSNKEATNKAMLEFRHHEINKKRDQAFLATLLEFWEQVGGEKLAILNAGGAHLDRLAENLPAELRFVQASQQV